MEQLYKKYINLQKMLVTYRKYHMNEVFLKYDDFKKTIQNVGYVTHTAVKYKGDDKKTDTGVNDSINNNIRVYLFKKNNIYVKSTPYFKKLIDKLGSDKLDLIIISKNPLSIYINKSLLKYKHLNVYNYLHRHFILDLPNGPLCSPHQILTGSEIEQLCAKDLITHPLSLPTIYINDPQIVGLNADIGDIIKITSISEITGYVNRYRIVAPENGKIQQKLNSNTDITNKKKYY
jgi:DNA-directed RNA polymerase subunit H (RpoH/RPB5)